MDRFLFFSIFCVATIFDYTTKEIFIVTIWLMCLNFDCDYGRNTGALGHLLQQMWTMAVDVGTTMCV